MNGTSGSCGQGELLQNGIFSIAKVRKYKVGERGVIQVSEFHKIHRSCTKKRLALSEGNPESFIKQQQNG